MKIGTNYYFYHNDHLGTPQKLTGTKGSIVWSGKYRVFAKVQVEVAKIENHLRFPGQHEITGSALEIGHLLGKKLQCIGKLSWSGL